MLTEPQKKHLRSLAHPRKVIVQTGNAGLTDAVVREIELALLHHELVKVRVVAGDRDERDAQIARAVELTRCELVQRIGHVAILYRPNPETKDPIRLP
jgi:RNA-binding protein